MKLKAVVHEAQEGGYWAHVPEIPGCTSQGETLEELLQNLHEAVEACLSIDAFSCYTEPIVFMVEVGPLSTRPEFLQLIQAAREEIKSGDFISLEEMRREPHGKR